MPAKRRSQNRRDPAEFLSFEGSYDDENEGGTKERPYERQIVWKNVVIFAYLHLAAIFGFYCILFRAKWLTVLWSLALHVLGALGITAGAHRLWSHKTYTASLPMRIILVICNCIAFQNDIIEWARDHRCHHKWSETHADPHNASRGLFFSHMGWLMVKKHPDVARKGAQIDLSDLYADPLLVFQRKHYPILVLLACFVLPTAVPVFLWGESAVFAFLTAAMFRYALSLHVTWCINSIAHVFGTRPYDRGINARENLMTALNAFGEGFHNYHHTFPQDYKTAEVPWLLNFTTVFIDFFAWIGWASDRKAVPLDRINKYKMVYGDGSQGVRERKQLGTDM